jgi:RNA recognition motif-containing protein
MSADAKGSPAHGWQLDAEPWRRPPMLRHFDNPRIDLHVGNLPYHLDDRALFELASKYGKVVDQRVVCDAKTGESKGFGFVRAATPEDQRAIIAGLHRHTVGARTLHSGPLIRGGPGRGGA